MESSDQGKFSSIESLDPGHKSFYRAYVSDYPLNYDYNLLYLVNVKVHLLHSSHVDS